ncbi:Hsp20/alpha crystallin family protein [Candidatus Micrarchaeota archaeon]|nr:Hsp20/alpha crystallin family protein [Candidatus Micrarchaeota archaeon]
MNEPSLECFETHSEVIVIAHLSGGVLRDEVKLSGNDKQLVFKIVGPSDPQQISRMGYYSHEILSLYGYTKTLSLPAAVNFSQAKAVFKHGILEVRLPKIF